jgi:hypothetical protein
MVRQRVENNLWHLAVEPANIQVGQMIDLAAHERSPETMRSPEVVAWNDAVIDPFYRYLFSRYHVTSSTLALHFLLLVLRLRPTQFLKSKIKFLP